MDINKYRKPIGISLIVISVICCLLYLNQASDKDVKEEPAPKSVLQEIPTAESTEMTGSKSEAYIRKSGKSKFELLWDDSLSNEETFTQVEKEPKKRDFTPKQASQEELFHSTTASTHSPATRTASVNPYRETAEEREARHQRRREEAIELAERMQDGSPKEKHLPIAETEARQEAEIIPLPKSQVKRSDIISSLDGWEGDGGFSSLDDDRPHADEDPYTPFRCMFARNAKVTDGQRVTVILLDDLLVSGISVPRNTHLMATCQISNRLELEFTSLEIGGRILPLGYEAYDVDGSKGIYCPDAGSTGKTIRSRGTNIISSGLSSRLGRVARDVAATGIAIVQSADGQRTVSIPAGYTFFIIKKKET